MTVRCECCECCFTGRGMCMQAYRAAKTSCQMPLRRGARSQERVGSSHRIQKNTAELAQSTDRTKIKKSNTVDVGVGATLKEHYLTKKIAQGVFVWNPAIANTTQ
eukprot:845306-Amphidinium_carterae.1